MSIPWYPVKLGDSQASSHSSSRLLTGTEPLLVGTESTLGSTPKSGAPSAWWRIATQQSLEAKATSLPTTGHRGSKECRSRARRSPSADVASDRKESIPRWAGPCAWRLTGTPCSPELPVCPALSVDRHSIAAMLPSTPAVSSVREYSQGSAARCSSLQTEAHLFRTEA